MGNVPPLILRRDWGGGERCPTLRTPAPLLQPLEIKLYSVHSNSQFVVGKKKKTTHTFQHLLHITRKQLKPDILYSRRVY